MRLLADLPLESALDEDAIDTGVFIAVRLRDWDKALTEADRQGLDALCRKLSVTKQVKKVYERKWGRPLSQDQLDVRFWPALIAVLLLRSPSEPHSFGNRDGFDLKRINAACEALDIAEEILEDREFDQLSEFLRDRLSEVLNL